MMKYGQRKYNSDLCIYRRIINQTQNTIRGFRNIVSSMDTFRMWFAGIHL